MKKEFLPFIYEDRQGRFGSMSELPRQSRHLFPFKSVTHDFLNPTFLGHKRFSTVDSKTSLVQKKFVKKSDQVACLTIEYLSPVGT